MKGSHLIGVWQPGIKEATALVNKWSVGDALVQFAPDADNKFAVWVMLALSRDARDMLLRHAEKATPRMTVIQ